MPYPLFLYNTLSRQKEEFKPINKDKIGLYSCGPTVYDYAHIGNMRSFILSDIVRRTLEYNNYPVQQVINITDVGHLTDDADSGEDKIEKAAREKHQSAEELTKPYIEQFLKDLENLHINTSDTIFPKATSYIDEQIDFIKSLEGKGFTYQTSDGIYFDTTKYPRYEELGNLNLKDQQKDARHATSEEKKNPADFALWKFSKPEENRLQEWSSPWGVGFPGWHTECSAMSADILGKSLDIHTGGEDHIPIHHTNERAISESVNEEKFVNYWLHNAFITAHGHKMSKSLNNFYTLEDLKAKNYDPLAYRYFILSGHYRTPLNFTLETLDQTQKVLEKINRDIKEMPSDGKIDEKFKIEFTEAINDDLNTSKALAVLHKVLKSNIKDEDKRKTIEDFDQVLAILNLNNSKEEIPKHIKLLAEDRQKARENKDWSLADDLRINIEEAGFEINDEENGYKIIKKSK